MTKTKIFEYREHFNRNVTKFFLHEISSMTTFGESFEDNAYKHPTNPKSEFCFNIAIHDKEKDSDIHVHINMDVDEAERLMKQLKSFIDYTKRSKFNK